MNVWLWMAIVFFVSSILYATTYRWCDFPADSVPADEDDMRRRADWLLRRRYIYAGYIAMSAFAGVVSLIVGFAALLR